MRNVIVVTALLAAGVATASHAADLMDVYQLAQKNDPTLQKAAATREAVEQNKPVALAALLPQLSASANYQKRTGDGSSAYYQSGTFATPETTTDSTSKGYNIRLNQPLFHWKNWVSLGRAGIQVAQAKVNFSQAQQDLIMRTAKAYFGVLTAQDTLAAARANETALRQQLRQIRKKQDVGLSAATDVQDIQAAYDQAHAQVIAHYQTLMGAEDTIIAIVGHRVGDLRGPSNDLPLKNPEPSNANAWIQRATQGNLDLIAARLGTKIAAREVAIEKAARYPTLDLSLARNYSTSDDSGALNGITRPRTSQFTGNSLSLQLTVPIYSGGAIAARSRQAKYRRVAAEAQTQITARQVRRQTRDAFLGVLTGISKVKALKAAVTSTTTALHANVVGRKIGTRTTVDVLNARKNLLDARTNYAQARYQYLIDSLLLKQAVGTLNDHDVATINRYLTRTTQDAASPPSRQPHQ